MNNSLKPCNGCGSFQNFYNNNINWEIKWSSRDNAFVFFLYVREINGVRIYADFVSNYASMLPLSNAEKIREIVERSANKLALIYGINLRG